jgi:O-antigen/teichoic acid export membrane protein
VNLRRQFIKNVLSNYTFLGLNFIIFFFLNPYINNTFGPERAGTWFLIASLVGYAGIVTFGIPSATEKYVAEFLARGSRDAVNRIVSTSLFLSLFVALIAVPIVALVVIFPQWLFRLQPAYLSEARKVLFIVGIDLVLAYPCSLMLNVLKGFNRHDVRTAVLIPALLIKAAGFVLVIRYGGGITAMALIQFVINMLGYAVVTVWILRHAPWLSIRLRSVERSTARLLMVYGTFQFFAMASDLIIANTDKIILANMVSMAMVSTYNIAAQLRGVGRLISSGLDLPLRTASSHLQGTGDVNALQMLATVGARVLLVGVGGLYVLYAAWGDQFVRLWQPRVFAETGLATYYCLLILSVPAFLTVALLPGIAIIYGLGRHQPHGVLGIIVAVLNVGLSIALAPLWGIYGVALGAAVPLFFIRGLYMYRYVPRVLQMSLGQFIVGVWGRPLLGLVPLAAVLWGVRCVLGFDRLLWLMVFFLVVAAGYAAWAYFVVLTPAEKQLVREIRKSLASTPVQEEATP